MRTSLVMYVLAGAGALGCAGTMEGTSTAVPPEAAPIYDKPASAAPVEAQPFTIVVLPDTQFYASNYPGIFEAQTRWIAANRDAQKIQLVVHEGDIVNSDVPEEWERATGSLRLLDGVVPYTLARGNHDLAGGVSRVGGLMDSYFTPSAFLQYPWFRETFEAGHMDGSFVLAELGGQKWVILSLEYGPRDAMLEWADRILREHADLPAIVVTHAYLYSDDTRYDHTRAPYQEYNPHDLALEGGSNDGEEMWQKLIARHSNVRFVLSGHVTAEDGTGRLTSTRADGTRCHQLLADYQVFGEGGDGFLRLMRFDPRTRKVQVQTYSPHLDLWKTDPENQFVLELE